MNRPSTPRNPIGTVPPPILTHPQRDRSSRLGYGLAVLMALVGATAAALWAVTAFLDQVQRPEQFARTEAPGVTSVTITQTGSHVVYIEATGRARITHADVTVTGPEGTDVEVNPYTMDLRYDVPGSPGALGTAVAVFDAERTGTYQVGTTAVPAAGPTTLAVGDDLAPQVIRDVAVPSTVGVLILLAGIGIALATWIHDEQRNRS
jgi:hypothetical protein